MKCLLRKTLKYFSWGSGVWIFFFFCCSWFISILIFILFELRENEGKEYLYNTLLSDIVYQGKEPYEPNNPARLAGLDYLFRPWFSHLIRDIETGINDGREIPEPPLSGHVSILFLRKGRLRSRSGANFDSLFPEDWIKHFFLGLHQGGEVFERKTGWFYPRPISHEAFLRMADKITPLLVGGRRWAFLFKIEDSGTFFMLVDMESLKDEELLAELQKSADYGLRDHQTFYYSELVLSALQNSAVFFLGLFLWLLGLLIWKFRNFGSYRWKLILLLGVPFCLMQFLSLIIFQELEKTERFRIRKQLQSAFISVIKDWEKNFDDFAISEAKRLCREYDQTRDVRTISSADSYLFFVGGLKGVQQTKPDPIDPFSLAFMELYAPQIFTYCPNAPVSSESEIRPYYSTASRQLLEAFGSDKMRLGRNFFNEEAKARFHFMSFGLNTYGWVWNTFGSGSEMLIFFALTYKKDLVQIYVRQKGLELLAKSPGIWLFFRTDDGFFEIQPDSRPELAGFENRIWSALSESNGVLTDVKIGDSDFVGMIVDSRYLDAGFAVLLPEDLAYREIFTLRKYFRVMQSLFTISFILAALWFGQLILSVLSGLKKGFKALIAENYAFRLPVPGHDERSVVLAGFNYMAQGIEEREKLLPFVAGQILSLFRDESGLVKERVTDIACVLFSDVRSFTTISEKLSPPEIVSMLNEYFTLWQKVVERHNGVIVQFIGDAVVVAFLEGLDENYRQSAILTAIDFCREFAVWNEERQKRGLLTIKNGIGLSCGEIIFSIFGDEHKKQLQAIGEAMHRSETLEAESKFNRYGSILLAEELTETAQSLNLSIAEHQSNSGFTVKAREICS